VAAASFLLLRCTTVDPGPNYVVPNVAFDADYFYCHVEPEVLVAKKCGPGDPSAGDGANGCHFNSSAVSGMALIDHPAIDCGDGDHPVDRTQVGTGSPAQANLQAASLEMDRTYTNAQLFLRPTRCSGQCQNHPRQVFDANDGVVAVIATWATK
jgi:hypothetical protein